MVPRSHRPAEQSSRRASAHPIESPRPPGALRSPIGPTHLHTELAGARDLPPRARHTEQTGRSSAIRGSLDRHREITRWSSRLVRARRDRSHAMPIPSAGTRMGAPRRRRRALDGGVHLGDHSSSHRTPPGSALAPRAQQTVHPAGSPPGEPLRDSHPAAPPATPARQTLATSARTWPPCWTGWSGPHHRTHQPETSCRLCSACTNSKSSRRPSTHQIESPRNSGHSTAPSTSVHWRGIFIVEPSGNRTTRQSLPAEKTSKAWPWSGW